MNCPRCDTEISNHEANDCLDIWISEIVMDEILTSPGYVRPRNKEQMYSHRLPKYSTSIAEAWRVVDKLNSEGYCVEIQHDCIAWSVVFMHIDGNERHTSDWKCSLETQICRAALKCHPSNS